MSSSRLRLGTRKSPMAMTQSAFIAELITARTGSQVELIGLTSFGDVTRAQLAQIGGTGVFVSGLREALLAGEIDLAVHSLKDLPTLPLPGVALGAVPPRDDPRDALVARDGAKLADLPAGATIGTGSPRRAAQLLHMRHDIRPVPVRGNAGTRLAKVSSGELDAVVLACAGLARIGQLELVSEVFEADLMLPAPGQGALAVECRAADAEVIGLLAALDDPHTRAAVTAERSVLAALAAGCSAPVGAYATGSPFLHLSAGVTAEGGATVVHASGQGPASQAAELGRQVADELLRRGAGRYVTVPAVHSSAAAHANDGEDAQ
jgi:hydroxymethylbilane synthase